MTKKELSKIKEESLLNELLQKHFDEWDHIYNVGNGGFSPDGFLLNRIRGEIIQLRQKRDEQFGSHISGQTSLFDDEVVEEREIPPQMPFNWMAEHSDEILMKNIEERLKTAKK